MRLKIRNLTKIMDDYVVLDKINYSFEIGKIYGLSGSKGSGKSVFFRCISGEEPFNKGHIRLQIDENDAKIGYSDVGCVFNDSRIPDVLTGREFIRLFLMNSNMKYDKETVDYYLGVIGMNDDFGDKYIKYYTESSKNLLQLLCLYISRPYIVLVEEPEKGYDDEEFGYMYKMLDELREDSIIIVSSAKEGMIEQVSDEIIEIKDGELLNADVDVVTLSMEE